MDAHKERGGEGTMAGEVGYVYVCGVEANDTARTCPTLQIIMRYWLNPGRKKPTLLPELAKL